MTERRPEPDRERLERDYEPQFLYCERLLDAVWRNRPRNDELNDRYAINLAAILGRAISTFRGVVVLVRSGLPDQAWMLNRSLFEDLVAVHWLAIPEKRDEALDLIEGQDARIVLTETDRKRKHVDRLARVPREDPALEAMRTELDEAFGRWGERTWFPNLYEAVKTIDAQEDSNGDLTFYYDIVQARANLHLHQTVLGLVNVLRDSYSRRGGRHFSYGQRASVDETAMMGVLTAATWCFANIGDLVVSEVTDRHEALRAEASDGDLFKLTPSDRARLRRNDLCWCGSGRKFKICHGA